MLLLLLLMSCGCSFGSLIFNYFSEWYVLGKIIIDIKNKSFLFIYFIILSIISSF